MSCLLLRARRHDPPCTLGATAPVLRTPSSEAPARRAYASLQCHLVFAVSAQAGDRVPSDTMPPDGRTLGLQTQTHVPERTKKAHTLSMKSRLHRLGVSIVLPTSARQGALSKDATTRGSCREQTT